MIVVVGPPCAGKSYYVAQHKQPGEVVVDMDALAVALGSPNSHDHPDAIREVAVAVRRSLVLSATAGRIRGGHVWIIEMYPTEESIQQYSRVGALWVVVDPGEDVCQERSAERADPRTTRTIISDWYRKPPQVPGR